MPVSAAGHNLPNPAPFPGLSKESVTGQAGEANSSSSTSSSAEQQAALNRLLAAYKARLAQGQSASLLANLRQQITAAAKALGQNIQLPKSSTSGSSEGVGSPTITGYGNKPLSILA